MMPVSGVALEAQRRTKDEVLVLSNKSCLAKLK